MFEFDKFIHFCVCVERTSGSFDELQLFVYKLDWIGTLALMKRMPGELKSKSSGNESVVHFCRHVRKKKKKK